MTLPCTILWPCIAPTYEESFSFDIMVVVNVYKLYSTCIKKIFAFMQEEKKSSVNGFIIFLREVRGNDIKWVKRNNLVMAFCSCTDK